MHFQLNAADIALYLEDGTNYKLYVSYFQRRKIIPTISGNSSSKKDSEKTKSSLATVATVAGAVDKYKVGNKVIRHLPHYSITVVLGEIEREIQYMLPVLANLSITSASTNRTMVFDLL